MSRLHVKCLVLSRGERLRTTFDHILLARKVMVCLDESRILVSSEILAYFVEHSLGFQSILLLLGVTSYQLVVFELRVENLFRISWAHHLG